MPLNMTKIAYGAKSWDDLAGWFSGRREVHLTTRQLDILLALQGPRRLPEIAAEMQVTPNTLKGHLKYLYKKLNAKNRRQAVERARALDLLD